MTAAHRNTIMCTQRAWIASGTNHRKCKWTSLETDGSTWPLIPGGDLWLTFQVSTDLRGDYGLLPRQNTTWTFVKYVFVPIMPSPLTLPVLFLISERFCVLWEFLDNFGDEKDPKTQTDLCVLVIIGHFKQKSHWPGLILYNKELRSRIIYKSKSNLIGTV